MLTFRPIRVDASEPFASPLRRMPAPRCSHPPYRYIPEMRPYAQVGDDVLGWQSVYMQKVSFLFKGFTTKDVGLGNVFGDDRGMMVY